MLDHAGAPQNPDESIVLRSAAVKDIMTGTLSML